MVDWVTDTNLHYITCDVYITLSQTLNALNRLHVDVKVVKKLLFLQLIVQVR